MRIVLSFIFSVFLAFVSHSQELNCTVEINTDQLQGVSKDVFETLKESMTEYLNTTHFSNAQFSPIERIECRLFFTIKEYDPSTDQISGDLQVQSTRPVFNSTYTTTLLNFKDTKITFTYSQGEPLVYSLNNMESQLTAILNFYANLILALDFDSFASRGGQTQFDRLAQIVQMAQSAGESGWKAFEDKKNRSALLALFTDPSTQGVRDLLYNYHRQGLDQMSQAPDKGRASITTSLSEIGKVYQIDPMSVGISLFKDAKLDELVNIYSDAPQTERENVVELLTPIYPTEATRIKKIKEGRQKTF